MQPPGIANSPLPAIGSDESDPERPKRRLLDPIDRASEILFALIMVLAITCSFSVAESGRDDIHAMLIGALGCNLAWGIVDAVMYLMAGLTERARSLRTLRELQSTSDAAQARHIIASSIPPMVACTITPEQLDAMRARLAELPDPPVRTWLSKDDWLGALAVCLWVF